MVTLAWRHMSRISKGTTDVSVSRCYKESSPSSAPLAGVLYRISWVPVTISCGQRISVKACDLGACLSTLGKWPLLIKRTETCHLFPKSSTCWTLFLFSSFFFSTKSHPYDMLVKWKRKNFVNLIDMIMVVCQKRQKFGAEISSLIFLFYSHNWKKLTWFHGKEMFFRCIDSRSLHAVSLMVQKETQISQEQILEGGNKTCSHHVGCNLFKEG